MDQATTIRQKLHKIVFESNTRAGRLFDEILIVCILASVFVVIVDSVHSIRDQFGVWMIAAEWGFTLIFTIEYLARLYSAKRPFRYGFSFFGWVDLLSILPTYLALLFPGTQYLTVVRIIRVLRVFRIFKLAQHIQEAEHLITALKASRRKIQVFLAAVLTMVTILGSLMYVIEGGSSGFTSIPKSIYWAIVTLTTVGYGDISPQSPLGQALASVVMILGYALIIVPTGIVTAELTHSPNSRRLNAKTCPQCADIKHDIEANFCKYCGHEL